MILADTSAWIDFFRRGSATFAARLAAMEILMHPVVLGELATGNLRSREKTLSQLLAMPRAQATGFEECLQFLEANALQGSGLGWSDIQLLHSCHRSGLDLWTLDKALATAARDLGVGSQPPEL
jgi:predicted nucleic acid-binding protein